MQRESPSVHELICIDISIDIDFWKAFLRNSTIILTIIINYNSLTKFLITKFDINKLRLKIHRTTGTDECSTCLELLRCNLWMNDFVSLLSLLYELMKRAVESSLISILYGKRKFTKITFILATQRAVTMKLFYLCRTGVEKYPQVSLHWDIKLRTFHWILLSHALVESKP